MNYTASVKLEFDDEPHIYILFIPFYHENNGAVNYKNRSMNIEQFFLTVFNLFHYDFSKYAKCICKIREM